MGLDRSGLGWIALPSLAGAGTWNPAIANDIDFCAEESSARTVVIKFDTLPISPGGPAMARMKTGQQRRNLQLRHRFWTAARAVDHRIELNS